MLELQARRGGLQAQLTPGGGQLPTREGRPKEGGSGHEWKVGEEARLGPRGLGGAGSSADRKSVV